ncbi:PREDICTED: WPP domain-interacting protein 2-like [Fragaria vesca subsp. vesca]|uniref:WPP domain-interacting protein 2-like n=1 Tax=Fragaria vesca subsp. vesca TaxID=101020 RepID=UPI0002C322B0|nr:PREDICTED: WPP domain-interacting protein 2-like [Fragaria vesca subsp. vesca]
MDLGSESVDDNVKPEPVSHGVVDDDDGDSVEIRNNGSCANGIGNGVGTGDNHVDTAPAVGLTLSAGKSPVGESNSAPKGQGLRRWRRIPRIVGHDGGGNAVDDSSRKRGMPGLEIPDKGRNASVEADHNNSEGSVGSVNMMRNAGVGDGFGFGGASPDSRYAGGSGFAARADSENSEDRSSKSSTAASVPRGRYDVPPLTASQPRNRAKNASTKSRTNSAQSAQPGRGQSESSKKLRGDRVKIEKENSHSSMESDSRSSNFVFMQAAPLSSNGKQSRRSMSQDRENSDEVQTGYRRENAVEAEEFLQDLDTDLSWVGKLDKKKKHGSFADMDALAESMFNFQTVQEALQKEVQKFGEIGKGPVSSGDNLVKPLDPSSSDLEIIESNLSEQLGSEKIGQTFSNSLEAQILSLKQHVKLIEGKLDETRARLEVKESRVAELEYIVNISKSFKEESGSTIELQVEQYRELEAEVESLFRQKIEAEVEYIVIRTTTQKVKFATGDQIALIEEQEAVAGEQARILNKLGETQIRAAKLKERTEELGKYYGDILGTEDVFTMPNKLFKVSSCFFVQLLLLVLAVWFFLLQSSPPQGVVVPT